MRVVNTNESYNQHNGYRSKRYELDGKISNMSLLTRALKSFETDDVKMTYCIATLYNDDDSTGRGYFDNVDEMLEYSNNFNDYVFFDANYANKENGEYAFSVVIYGNSNIIEQVINPNKVSKKETGGRKK